MFALTAADVANSRTSGLYGSVRGTVLGVDAGDGRRGAFSSDSVRGADLMLAPVAIATSSVGLLLWGTLAPAVLLRGTDQTQATQVTQVSQVTQVTPVT